jgi:hypothetical protein
VFDPVFSVFPVIAPADLPFDGRAGFGRPTEGDVLFTISCSDFSTAGLKMPDTDGLFK